MKNKLAENMLRFGVKNLTESNIKNINKSLLTEAINLKGDPRLPKVAKPLADQWNKGVTLPAAVMGQYIFVMPRTGGTPSFGSWNSGIVLQFWGYNFSPVGAAVVLQDWNATFGGRFTIDTKANTFGEVVEADPANPMTPNTSSPQSVAERMNMLNQIPLNVLNAAFAADPGKDKLIKLMSTFAASPTGKQTMAMVQGNAKAFYAGIMAPVAAAAAAPTAAKPATTPPAKPAAAAPVKKP